MPWDKDFGMPVPYYLEPLRTASWPARSIANKIWKYWVVHYVYCARNPRHWDRILLIERESRAPNSSWAKEWHCPEIRILECLCRITWSHQGPRFDLPVPLQIIWNRTNRKMRDNAKRSQTFVGGRKSNVKRRRRKKIKKYEGIHDQVSHKWHQGGNHSIFFLLCQHRDTCICLQTLEEITQTHVALSWPSSFFIHHKIRKKNKKYEGIHFVRYHTRGTRG